jgi:hypothetical protein
MNLVEKQREENEVLHHIRVRLYPNNLPQVEGEYVAKTDSEATLNISQICTALKNRAGYNCDHKEMVEHVTKFLDEAVYQLCDGFRINLGYFSAYPNIGGTFATEHDSCDSEKNPLSFRFRTGKHLENLIKHIAVDVDGAGKNPAFIKQFIDRDADSVNALYTPGHLFTIVGKKIKIAGDSKECGVYFVPVDDPSKAVKVERLAENRSSVIVGVIPETDNQRARIEVRTQYYGSGAVLLKTPRIITSNFIVGTAA